MSSRDQNLITAFREYADYKPTANAFNPEPQMQALKLAVESHCVEALDGKAPLDTKKLIEIREKLMHDLQTPGFLGQSVAYGALKMASHLLDSIDAVIGIRYEVADTLRW